MAKNKGFAVFDELEEVEVKEIIKDAGLKKLVNKGGRKKKEVKADQTIRVYVNKDQKKALEEYCELHGYTESTLVKHLLMQKGVFNRD